MKYVKLVVESQQAQKFLENNNIPEIILDKVVPEVIQYNSSIIKENIHLFIEDDISNIFENISDTISSDLYVLLETYSNIYADNELSAKDKLEIVIESSITDKFEDYKDYIKDKAPELAKSASKLGSSLHSGIKDVGEKISDIASNHGLSDTALGYGGVGAGALALLGGAKLAKMAYNRWKAKKEEKELKSA